MSKDVFYFPHDCNARRDQKILAARTVFGASGYAWYFMLIEILREQSNYMIEINEYTFKSLSKEFDCTTEEAEKFISLCCNKINLLSRNDKNIWSESLLKRMANVDEKREKAKASALARWGKDANAMRTQCERNAIKERKGKEIKEKNSIPPVQKQAKPKTIFTEAPEKIEITDKMKAWAISKGITCDLKEQTEQMLDHHRKKGDRFKDWQAAWRTWMRNSKQFNTKSIDPPSSVEYSTLHPWDNMPDNPIDVSHLVNKI